MALCLWISLAFQQPAALAGVKAACEHMCTCGIEHYASWRHDTGHMFHCTGIRLSDAVR